jgi:DmsE family decaheme c-type cytochrome
LRVLKRARIKSGVFVMSSLMILTTLVVAHRSISAEQPARESVVCLDCHDDKLSTLDNTPHQILADIPEDKAVVACTDCHPGDSNHYEEDAEEYPMTNPASADFNVAAQICASCHQNSHQQNMRERNPHFENGVGCTDCHSIHGAKRAGLLKDKEVKLCYSCHTDVRGQFAQPYRHPVWDEIVRCSDCHMSLDRNKRLLSGSRMDEACFQCHQYFQGPFPYEHQATIGWSTQEGGCMACHRPHGSNNPRMLNQPYESPDYALCSQCHAVPGHNFNPRHGNEWEGVPCNDCHVDIHGSYQNRYFLSPDLQSQGCFNAGCHQY